MYFDFDDLRLAGPPIPPAGDFLFLGILLLAPQIGDSTLIFRNLLKKGKHETVVSIGALRVARQWTYLASLS